MNNLTLSSNSTLKRYMKQLIYDGLLTHGLCTAGRTWLSHSTIRVGVPRLSSLSYPYERKIVHDVLVLTKLMSTRRLPTRIQYYEMGNTLRTSAKTYKLSHRVCWCNIAKFNKKNNIIYIQTCRWNNIRSNKIHTNCRLQHVVNTLLHVDNALLYVDNALLHMDNRLLHVSNTLLHENNILFHDDNILPHVDNALLSINNTILPIDNTLMLVDDTLLHITPDCISITHYSMLITHYFMWVTLQLQTSLTGQIVCV